jgi:hypothetical protein
MPWFRVEESFYSHPKVLALDRQWRAHDIGAWLLAGTWASQQLTDGFVSAASLKDLGIPSKTADRLVKAGLWEYTDDGYRFHDWSKYQPSRVDVLRRRESDRLRQQRGRDRQRRGHDPGSPPVTP